MKNSLSLKDTVTINFARGDFYKLLQQSDLFREYIANYFIDQQESKQEPALDSTEKLSDPNFGKIKIMPYSYRLDSSVIKFAGFAPIYSSTGKRTRFGNIHINFKNNTVMVYKNVPQDVFVRLIDPHNSADQIFNQELRGIFESK